MSLLLKVLIAQNHTLDTHADLSSGTKDKFGSFHLLIYFKCASNDALTRLHIHR